MMLNLMKLCDTAENREQEQLSDSTDGNIELLRL
jgi:hypothetical protein